MFLAIGIFLLFLFYWFKFDLYCQVGATDLTELAADAVFWTHCHGPLKAVKFEYLLGAECHAHAAALAPIAIDEMFLEFSFRHDFCLSFVAQLSSRARRPASACSLPLMTIVVYNKSMQFVEKNRNGIAGPPYTSQ
jgi:hypothetical protein